MAQNLTTNIIINAKTGNGFGKVGATLTEMGMIVNGLSQQLINFGEDSVRVYRDYELSMRDAEVALSTTYGRGTQQLQTVMNQLDTSATEWAATTIFHTNDVANAISEAAHAGWDYDRIMTGIPEAMELAQAGSMDLSDALNYIVKSTYAAGVEFDDLNHFTDIWAYSANKSATTIGEIGDAMLRMGSTMRFAANPEELMTLIAVMANSGYVGSEAGTLIRNSMMRLIAPTDKANKALAAMGATAEEIAEVAGDESISAAYESLIEHGFHGLYDESGNMRSVLDVYSEMAVILGEMAGGIENITGNEEAMNILGTIFPTRTITGALNLMNAAADNYDGLYDKLMSGEAEGYGAYASETMMDTLNGTIETFESKVERLKQLVGEELKPLVQDAAGFAGEIVDRIATMDPEGFSRLVNGLTAIAAVGPGLLTAGAAFRLLGIVATPVGAAATALTAALTAAYIQYEKYQRDFADNFGDMELDDAELQSFLSGLNAKFSASRAQVDQWKETLNQAAQSYETASATFSSKLTTAMITGTTLTEDDYSALSALADQMFEAATGTIEARASEASEYWKMLFHYDEDNPYLQELLSAINQQVEDSTSEARAAGDALHKALFQAINNDGVLSPDELQEIQSYVSAYNKAVADAMAADEERRSRAALSAKLHMQQTASLKSTEAFAAEITADRDALLEAEQLEFLTKYYDANGLDVSEESMKEAERLWQIRKAELIQPYNDVLMQLHDNLRQETDLSPEDDAHVLAMEYEALGGQQGIDQAKEVYSTAGMTEQLEAIEQFENAVAEVGITSTKAVPWNPLTWLKGYETAADQTAWADVLGAASAAAMGTSYTPIAQQEAQVERWQSFFEQQAQMAADNPYMFMSSQEGVAGVQAGQALSLQFQGNFDPLQERLDEFDGQELTAVINGNTDPAKQAIDALNGTTVSVNVVEAGVAVSGSGFSGRAGKFAEGGRATEASIFGEGDTPEWAIPEEHSERTAALLNAARAASGFTWPDLLARFGGFNAEANAATVNISYSPVIHANDARGVEDALKRDKALFSSWLKKELAEAKMRDEMEVYT